MKTRSRVFIYPILIFFLLSNILPEEIYAKNDGASTKWYKKEYTFTENWFTDKIPFWTKILQEFRGKPDIKYLEIGTFEGRSALWLLENILTHPTSKIIIIDAFKEDSYRTFTSNINLSGEANKFNILVGFSTEKIRELPLNSIDFAYIDGSGKGIVMLPDLVNTWNLVKVDGMIICSRYALDDGLRKALDLKPKDPGPYEAIDAFLKLYKPYMKVLAFEENQVILRKIRE
ncbi:MAG: class I SAM-dependent methyltransferase [Rhodomicrobium sp.]